MKTVILCGGRGTRLGEHGRSVPKALVEIGGKPIIWHLLKTYSSAGLDEFVLCLGYLGDQIREYFVDDQRSVLTTSVTPDSETVRFDPDGENWKVTLVDTGLDTNTGGRIKRAKSLLENEESFCVTYGDGLANIDLRGLIDFHHARKKTATLTAIQPFSNFGVLAIDDQEFVTQFREKPQIREWINGGFFVFERQILEYLDDNCVLEQEPLKTLAKENQLSAFKHGGFWKCMDTYKDNLEFNEMWSEGNALWKVW